MLVLAWFSFREHSLHEMQAGNTWPLFRGNRLLYRGELHRQDTEPFEGHAQRNSERHFRDATVGSCRDDLTRGQALPAAGEEVRQPVQRRKRMARGVAALAVEQNAARPLD